MAKKQVANNTGGGSVEKGGSGQQMGFDMKSYIKLTPRNPNIRTVWSDHVDPTTGKHYRLYEEIDTSTDRVLRSWRG